MISGTMDRTPQDVANAAASNLRERINAAYPDLDVVVEEWDYCRRLRVRVTDPTSDRSLKAEDLRIDDQTFDERADLMIGAIRDWLAKGR